MRGPLSLLIVADQVLLREGLLSLADSAGEFRAVGTRAENVVGALHACHPEVALIDVSTLPNHGQTLLRSVQSHAPPVRVLILDDVVRPLRLAAVVKARVWGYWTKRASFAELSDAILRIAGGATSFCGEAQQYLVCNNGHVRFRPTADAKPVARLSPRETQVLAMLAGGLTVHQCADRLTLSPSTVDNHKTRMMKKLGVHKTADLVRLAVSQGIAGGVD